MARRSKMRGDIRLRRTLRNIHKTMDNELTPAMRNAAERVLATQQQLMPKDTGAAAAALKIYVAPSGLMRRSAFAVNAITDASSTCASSSTEPRVIRARSTRGLTAMLWAVCIPRTATRCSSRGAATLYGSAQSRTSPTVSTSSASFRTSRHGQRTRGCAPRWT